MASLSILTFAFAVSADALYRRVSLLSTMTPTQVVDAWQFLLTVGFIIGCIVTIPYVLILIVLYRQPLWSLIITRVLQIIIIGSFFFIHAITLDRMVRDGLKPWTQGSSALVMVIGIALLILIVGIRRRYARGAALAPPLAPSFAFLMAACVAILILIAGAMGRVGGSPMLYALVAAALLVGCFPRDVAHICDSWQWSFILAVTLGLLTIPWTGASYLRENDVRDEQFPMVVDAARRYPGIDHIIVFSFDALAAERMSLYGNPRVTTPNLDALGTESFVFERMHAEADATQQSLAAMQTGVHYGTNRLRSYGQYLAGEDLVGVMPRALDAAGWTPAYVLYAPEPGQRDIFSRIAVYNQASPDLLERYYGSLWYLNLQRIANRYAFISFEWIDALLVTYTPTIRAWLRKTHTDLADQYFAPVASEHSGEGMYRWAQRYLTEALPEHAYLRIHIYPPHQPFHRVPPYAGRFLPDVTKTHQWFEARIAWNGAPLDPQYQELAHEFQLIYEEYLLAVDAAFGEFLSFLKESGLYDRSLLVVTSDHGSAFEHGELFHVNRMFYEQTVRVPLIVHMPGQRTGQRIPEYVQQVDITPTVLDLLGVTVPPWMEGRSVRPLLVGDTDARASFQSRITFSQGIPPSLELNDDPSMQDLYAFAAYREPYKLIYRFVGDHNLAEQPVPSGGAHERLFAHYDHVELFNLATDPGELNNLATRMPKIRDELLAAIRERIAGIQRFQSTLR